MMTDRQQALYTALGTGALAFAFFWLPVPRLFEFAGYLLILLFVPMALSPSSRDLRRDPVVGLGLAFFLYILLSIIWHRYTLPDHFPSTTSDRRFLRVLYFVAIAYAVARSRVLSAWRLLGVAFAGLLVYLVGQFDAAEWGRAWRGERIDFGMQNAQHTSIVFATCVLALSLFTPRFYRWTKTLRRITASLYAVLWSGALLLSVWGVFVSQTRAVWLGLGLAILLLPGIHRLACRLQGRTPPALRKPLLIGVAGAVLLGVLASSFTSLELDPRFDAEKVTWDSLRQAAMHADRDLNSIEIRVASWSAAVGWIREKPFMGWGGRGSRPLIDHSDLFSEAFKQQFNHLHNAYLQVLVEIGFIGAMFIAVLMALVGRASIQSYRRQRMPLDVFVFAWSFFLFWLVVSLFESYIIYQSGTYLIAIITGFVYSWCVRQPPTGRGRAAA